MERQKGDMARGVERRAKRMGAITGRVTVCVASFAMIIPYAWAPSLLQADDKASPFYVVGRFGLSQPPMADIERSNGDGYEVSFDPGFATDFGVGYGFRQFRFEVSLDYSRAKIADIADKNQNSNFNTDASLETLSVFHNVYWDVPVGDTSPVQPYAGLGLGFTHLFTDSNDGKAFGLTEESVNGLSVQLMVGADYKLNDHWRIGGQYRYRRMPSIDLSSFYGSMDAAYENHAFLVGATMNFNALKPRQSAALPVLPAVTTSSRREALEEPLAPLPPLDRELDTALQKVPELAEQTIEDQIQKDVRRFAHQTQATRAGIPDPWSTPGSSRSVAKTPEAYTELARLIGPDSGQGYGREELVGEAMMGENVRRLRHAPGAVPSLQQRMAPPPPPPDPYVTGYGRLTAEAGDRMRPLRTASPVQPTQAFPPAGQVPVGQAPVTPPSVMVSPQPPMAPQPSMAMARESVAPQAAPAAPLRVAPVGQAPAMVSGAPGAPGVSGAPGAPGAPPNSAPFEDPSQPSSLRAQAQTQAQAVAAFASAATGQPLSPPQQNVSPMAAAPPMTAAPMPDPRPGRQQMSQPYSAQGVVAQSRVAQWPQQTYGRPDSPQWRPEDAVRAPKTVQPVATPPLDPEAMPQIKANPQGNYAVQLASFKDPKNSDASWAMMRQRYGSLLSGLRKEIRETDLPGRGHYYQLFAAGLDEADAQALCHLIKHKGHWCSVARL